MYARVLGRDGVVPRSEFVRTGISGVGDRARQFNDQLPIEGKVVAVAACYFESGCRIRI